VNPRPLLKTLALFAHFAVLACAATPHAEDSSQAVEATSLLGEPLERPALEPATAREYEEALAVARAVLEADPASEEAAIWVGRRLGYLGRYREAIAFFTKSLERHPGSYRLLRHRGHRYLTTRRFEAAEADLATAAVTMMDFPDQIEPDGIPNARNEARTTDRFNVWYHLGLVRYFFGDYQGSLEAWRPCMQISRANGDMLVASTYWMVLALRRLGMDDDARAQLAAPWDKLEVIENQDYRALLQYFRGEVTEKELLGRHAVGSVAWATVAYGIAAWSFAEGRRDRSVELLEKILDDSVWQAFGHIAAEADLARMRG
jgi:tetratricopeptide (TPR) repeat protein